MAGEADQTDGPLVSPTVDKKREVAVAIIRSDWPFFLGTFANAHGPNGRKPCTEEWNQKVDAGCIERLGSCFFWNNLHWQINKTELLQHVKEWNEALEKYCDDMGLTGAEREAVATKHTAIPLAPCANPSCNEYEKEVKEFQRCSRCRKVAYCSQKCQKENWKSHKKLCTNM
jgi:hypothetical protein